MVVCGCAVFFRVSCCCMVSLLRFRRVLLGVREVILNKNMRKKEQKEKKILKNKCFCFVY